MLVGADSGMFQLDPDKADRLAREADELAGELGGSLLVTTSRRTPPGIAARLDAALASPHFVYEWQAGASDNPYGAFLALADRLIVTGESMSMLAEACATRRPVYVFDMHDRGPMSATARLRWLKDGLRYRAWTHRLAQVLAPERLRRDVSRLHAARTRLRQTVEPEEES